MAIRDRLTFLLDLYHRDFFTLEDLRPYKIGMTRGAAISPEFDFSVSIKSLVVRALFVFVFLVVPGEPHLNLFQARIYPIYPDLPYNAAIAVPLLVFNRDLLPATIEARCLREANPYACLRSGASIPAKRILWSL